MNIQDAAKQVASELAPNNEEKRKLIADLAVDVANLAMREAAGEDVTRELAHVTSQTLNLARSELIVIESRVAGWFSMTIRRTIERGFGLS